MQCCSIEFFNINTFRGGLNQAIHTKTAGLHMVRVSITPAL